NALVRLDGYLVQQVADQNDQLLTITAPPTTPTPPPPTTPSRPVATTTQLTAGPVVRHGSFRPATTTLTIDVTPASGKTAPSGTVALVYNGSIIGLGRVQVVNGVATVTFNVALYGTGNFTFSAQYLGSNL